MDTQLCVDRETLLALMHDARLIANPPGQIPPGALAGERTSKQQGRGLNFDSLRRYQPGDDVRLIDWQATARLRAPGFGSTTRSANARCFYWSISVSTCFLPLAA